MPSIAKSTFRISKPNLQRADEIGERLGGLDRTAVMNLALMALADRLGLTHQDAALAADSLAARYGDDGVLLVTIEQWDDHGEGVTAVVSSTVNGEEQADWSVILSGTTRVQMRPERPGHTATIVHVQHEPTQVDFVLGRLDVQQGASIGVRIRDLPEHVVALPSEGEMDAAELRRHVRDSLRLRRVLRLAEHPDLDPETETEELPLDDD